MSSTLLSFFNQLCIRGPVAWSVPLWEVQFLLCLEVVDIWTKWKWLVHVGVWINGLISVRSHGNQGGEAVIYCLFSHDLKTKIFFSASDQTIIYTISTFSGKMHMLHCFSFFFFSSGSICCACGTWLHMLPMYFKHLQKTCTSLKKQKKKKNQKGKHTHALKVLIKLMFSSEMLKFSD